MSTYSKTIAELYEEELDNQEWCRLMKYAECTGHTGDTLCIEVCAKKAPKDKSGSCNQHGHRPDCPKAEGVYPVPMHKWVPMQKPKNISLDDAKGRLARGITHTDPTGAKVHMGQKLLDHLREGGHLERVLDLPLLEKLIKDPHEIWEGDGGGRTYIAAYLDGNKKYAVAFSTDDASLEINTFYDNTQRMQGRRDGKLIYSRR